MNTPTKYTDISDKALKIRLQYDLDDVTTLLYNHICRGDFKLRNSDGQKFYDKNNNGFGWSGDRKWVKKKLNLLIKKNLVKFESLYDCRDSRYTSWYFYDPNYDLNDLVDASCYITTNKLAMIKYYLNINDGFSKNEIYDDLELIKKNGVYSFKYKGEENIYAWDNNGKGEKQNLTWLTGKFTHDSQITYDNFSNMIHDIWSFLANDGYEYINNIPNYNTRRTFKI